jgi:hypothetical protein
MVFIYHLLMIIYHKDGGGSCNGLLFACVDCGKSQKVSIACYRFIPFIVE